MYDESNIKFRDPAVEKVIVKILVEDEARADFLRDRVKYLAEQDLPAEAANVLVQLTDDQVNRTAQEYAYNLARPGGGDPVGEPGGQFKGSRPCGSSTFADLFCDS